MLATLRQELEAMARARGFDALGVSGVDLSRDAERLERWLAAGMHGEMGYMSRHGTRRSRPQELVPGTVRVLSVRMNYWPPDAGDALEALAETDHG
jgi:epoxyqueuosine reductase